MFSIFTHVIKPVRDTHSEPGLPLLLHWQIDITAMNGNSKFKVANRQFELALMGTVLQSIDAMLEKCWKRWKLFPAELLA